MKNNKMLIGLVAGFVVLLGGAYVLYDALGETMKNRMPGLVAETDEAGDLSDAAGSSDGKADAGAGAQSTESKEQQEEQMTAPDFTVVDAEGKEVKLSDFFGKPIVLNFWASWCGPCKSEMPDFDAAYAAYGGEITFLMVNMTDGQRETVSVASDFVTAQGYAFPVYFDTEMEAAYTYSVMSIPSSYFIDADGRLVAHAKGAIDAATLETGIGMIYSAE